MRVALSMKICTTVSPSEQAQVEQQLLELSSTDGETVVQIFIDKATLIIQQGCTGAGHFARAQRAAAALVSLAGGVDSAARKSKGDEWSSSKAICRLLLE